MLQKTDGFALFPSKRTTIKSQRICWEKLKGILPLWLADGGTRVNDVCFIRKQTKFYQESNSILIGKKPGLGEQP